MTESLTEHSNADFKKIICRRVPIKLQQFARLLNDITETDIDSVRIKAMQSQIRKTKETCFEYGVESTGNLLSRIESQLQLDEETLDSQKPLIKRFTQRLQSHAERLKLGQIDSGSTQAIKESKQEADQLAESAPETDSQPATENNNTSGSQTETPDPTTASSSAAPETKADDMESKGQTNQTAAYDHYQDQPIAFDERSTSAVIEPEYEFKHSIVDDVSSAPTIFESSSELIIYWCIDDANAHTRLKEQMQDFGYEVENSSLDNAIEQASGNSQKVVITRLENFDDNISEPVNETSYMIVLAEHDTLESRLKGIRLGSTLFFAEPIDTIKLMEQLDQLESCSKMEPFRVAVMEDSKAQAKFNDKVLSTAGFETCIIIEPTELLNSLSNFDPEVIFMDMQMPGCNGIELTRILRQQERFQTVPIVFLSAEENHDKQREAMTSGGTAFIEKPVKKDQLLFTAELYARRSRNLQPHLARDFQTGLNSSSLLKEQLTIEAERAMRQNDSMFLALIEMNDLPELNQTHGYAFGERAVQQLARLLRQRLRKTDCIGFFDSHRVGVILSHCADQEAESVMSYLTQTFANTPVAYEGQRIQVSLSVGLSRLGKDFDIQRLVKRAEAALSEAKNHDTSHLIWAHEAR